MEEQCERGDTSGNLKKAPLISSPQILQANKADTHPSGYAQQVTYFKQRRVMEYKKKQTMDQLAKEGARAAPEGMPLPGGGQGKSPA